ncbi:hypothetical protein Salat_2393500 [Sesamum alatum]|uniref:Uncharacterized protein n=1 Tax=Sesamum alatum TaxID=300844 RepID=A0AAE1XYC8_9LAMI|nr:hypothetical protein Salat_2393500 [Sesamum alatum]
MENCGYWHSQFLYIHRARGIREVVVRHMEYLSLYNGSIANELYSEVVQSSSVELVGESTPVEANDNSYENDPSDLWYDDGSSCEDSVKKLNRTSDMDRKWQRRRDQFHTLGYPDGLIAGKEAAATRRVQYWL